MTIPFQGFTIRNNLSEAAADRTILNNLGGSPIGDDIGLLFNNNRNTSSLLITADNISGETVTIPNAQSIFSNNNIITVGEVQYYVKNSNGIDSFKLSTNVDLLDTVSNPPVGTYIRSDAITFENITNYSIIRRNTNTNRTEEVSQLGDINQTSRSVILGGRSVKQIVDSVESNIDFYNLRKTKSLTINKDFLGSKQLQVSGVSIITDLDNVNSTGLTNSSPGLFIYDATTNSGSRAFSSTDNPWQYDAEIDLNNLIVTTSAFSVGVLKFSSDHLELNSKGSPALATNVPSQTITENFTHTIPITINNELYYLCAKLES